MTTGARRDSPVKRNAHDRKRHALKSPESTAKFFAFTMDANTAQIVKLESLDASGASHELSEDEKASLARATSKEGLEEVLEQAFEAGIACVLGGEFAEDKAKESEEDAELRHLLLKPLIEHSAAKELMKREVLNRAILETLIEHSMKARPASAEGGRSGDLQQA
jgi:hypothetical protein